MYSICILFGPLVCTNYGQAFGPEEFAETCEGRSGFRFCESVPKNMYTVYI